MQCLHGQNFATICQAVIEMTSKQEVLRQKVMGVVVKNPGQPHWWIAKQFDRVPCGEIIQGDPDDQAACWQRNKSEVDRPCEGKEGERLLQVHSKPFDSGLGEEGQFIHLVRLTDYAAALALCLKGEEDA